MDGTQSSKKELAPALFKVHDAVVECHFHRFVVTLSESLDHIAERLIAVGKTLAHGTENGRVGVAEILAEDVEVVVGVAHDEFHLVTHVLVVVFGDDILYETHTFFYLVDHGGLEVEHREELLKHAGEFASLAAFTLLKLAAELGGYGDKVEDVASVDVFVYIVHVLEGLPLFNTSWRRPLKRGSQ